MQSSKKSKAGVRRGAFSKQKGKRGERDWVAFLQELGLTAKRTAQNCGKSGDAADVVSTELSFLHFEVKRTEKFRLYAALEQAKGDSAGTGRVPVVAHRQNSHPWVIVIDAKDFVDLVHARIEEAEKVLES